MKIKSLPKLPKFRELSPEVVRVFDKIRFELGEDDVHGEFCWFAREYPRCYRHHLDHAEFRLKAIYAKYEVLHKHFEHELTTKGKDLYEMAISNRNVYKIYWDFEAYLSAINSALDILARIVGTAFDEQTPVSFNKLCAKTNLNGLVDILRKAKARWVSKMKDYRDCFIHYTPVDTLLVISLRQYSDGWEIRGELPVNPNARDILRFRYSRRVELLRYAISVYKHMFSLDAAIAKEVRELYEQGEFPKRIQNLFFIGGRSRD